MQGANTHLRAVTIFAMPIIMPSMAFAPPRQASEQASNSRLGIHAVYNRVSRLLSADIGSQLPTPMFEPTQA